MYIAFEINTCMLDLILFFIFSPETGLFFLKIAFLGSFSMGRGNSENTHGRGVVISNNMNA